MTTTSHKHHESHKRVHSPLYVCTVMVFFVALYSIHETAHVHAPLRLQVDDISAGGECTVVDAACTDGQQARLAVPCSSRTIVWVHQPAQPWGQSHPMRGTLSTLLLCMSCMCRPGNTCQSIARPTAGSWHDLSVTLHAGPLRIPRAIQPKGTESAQEIRKLALTDATQANRTPPQTYWATATAGNSTFLQYRQKVAAYLKSTAFQQKWARVKQQVRPHSSSAPPHVLSRPMILTHLSKTWEVGACCMPQWPRRWWWLPTPC